MIHAQVGICDRWVKDALLDRRSGNVSDFLALFARHGLPLYEAEMDWDGAFDDTLYLYDYNMPEALEFVRKALRQKTGSGD